MNKKLLKYYIFYGLIKLPSTAYSRARNVQILIMSLAIKISPPLNVLVAFDKVVTNESSAESVVKLFVHKTLFMQSVAIV
mgnify:CR=1 FL=1|jgi:hypothetical protein